MSMTLTQTKTALAINLTASFLAIGGSGTYVYTVRPGGAGGSIDPNTGIYTAPASVNPDPTLQNDTIVAKDVVHGTQVTSTIMVGDPLLLFCEIIWRQMGLDPSRVWIWDQKVFQPTDAGLYVAVAVPTVKPFANRRGPATIDGELDWSQQVQSLNCMATLDINVISRSTIALLQKEQVLLALQSSYSLQQQDANSFTIGKIPPNSQFKNLSAVDGAAIPYRFTISVNMQYSVSTQSPNDYFDTFSQPQVAVNA